MALFNFRAKRTDETAVTEPRRHHYEFAHVALPAFAFEGPADMLEVLGGPDAAEFLALLWKRVGEELPGRERLPVDGLGHRVWRGDDQVYVVVTLPKPLVAGEAWCVALFFETDREPPRLRYFALEFGTGEPPGTTVAEWNDEPERQELGAGPVPDAEAFYTYLSGLLAPHEDGETIEPCAASVYSIGDLPRVICASCHHEFEPAELMHSEMDLLQSQLVCREFEAEHAMLLRVRELYEARPEVEGEVMPAVIRAMDTLPAQMTRNLDHGLAYTILRAAGDEADALPPGEWSHEEQEVLRFLQLHYFRIAPRLEFVARRVDDLQSLLKRRLTCLNCNEGWLYMPPRDF